MHPLPKLDTDCRRATPRRRDRAGAGFWPVGALAAALILALATVTSRLSAQTALGMRADHTPVPNVSTADRHADAMASGCLPDGTPTAARLLTVVRRMVVADTGDYARARSMYHFPHMSAKRAVSRVAVVRARDVCTRVAATFRRVTRDAVSARPLYVIAVGDMFWVYDPAWATTESEFQPYVSFFRDLRVAGIGAA